jgi:hypothetical protein
MSGLVSRAVIVAEGVAAGASGPGSDATPGTFGMTSGVGVAEASAGRSRVAPASEATVTAIFMWRFMAVLSLFLARG